MIDIETAPALAYVWKAWDENISPDQIVENSRTICFCAHWLGSKHYLFFSEWEHGHQVMIEQAHALLSEADAVITFNGERFDLPKLRGEFILAGLEPPPPLTSIDLLKVVKKFGLIMNRLAFVGPLLSVGKKMKHEGFLLWRSVLEGDIKAQRRMEKYCIQDVIVTRKLYERIQPYISDHPHLGDNGGACGACGSTHTQMRGFRRTKYFKVQRLQCQDCGAWSTGARQKI